MLLHFIKSTVFEVFYSLTKDNAIIDKMVAFGHVTDIIQNLAYIFFISIPWGNDQFQLICSYLTLSIHSTFLSIIAVVFIFVFLANFSFLCYQVQKTGCIYTSNLLVIARYQYGLLSTLLYFPTIEQLIITISFDSPFMICASLICILLFIMYTALVALGAFLLFTPNPDPKNHNGRNSQKIDVFEILFKTIIAVGFAFLSPVAGCVILIVGWLLLYITTLYMPAFYNYKSNCVRSGVILGLFSCSIFSLIVSVSEKGVPFFFCYIALVLFVIVSTIGVLIYMAFEKQREIPSAIFIHALKSLDKKSASKRRMLLKNSVDEWVLTFWSPFQIVAYIRNLSNLVFAKNRESVILQMNLFQTDLEAQDDAENLVAPNIQIPDIQIVLPSTVNTPAVSRRPSFSPSFESRASSVSVAPSAMTNKLNTGPLGSVAIDVEIDKQIEGQNKRNALAKLLIQNFDEVARLVCLQLFESGKKKFLNSSWLKAQYMIFLEFSNTIFPKLRLIPSLQHQSDVILNATFLEEKSMDVHYILFSFYKKRLLERAKKDNTQLKNIVDIVAFSHDKEEFYDNLGAMITCAKRFTALLEKQHLQKISFDILVTYASEIQYKWHNAKLYLKKGLVRVPTSIELLTIYKEACETFDMNFELRDYLATVLKRKDGDKSEDSVVNQKKEMFISPIKLPTLYSKGYKVVGVYFKSQFSISLTILLIFFLITIFLFQSTVINLAQGNAAVLDYGTSSQMFLVSRYSYEHFQSNHFLKNCTQYDSLQREQWNNLISSPVYQSYKPNPFGQIVTNYDNGYETCTYEDSNYDFQWKTFNFLTDPSNAGNNDNLDGQLPSFYANFMEFFKKSDEQSILALQSMMDTIIYVFGGILLFLIVTMIPISYYFLSFVKKDMLKDSVEFQSSESSKKFESNLSKLQSMVNEKKEKGIKNKKEVLTTSNIIRNLEYKFILLLLLYLVFGGIAGYVYYDSNTTTRRYLDARTWVQVRTYLNKAIATSSSLYLKRVKENATMDLQQEALVALQAAVQKQKDVGSSFKKAISADGILIVNGTSGQEFWNEAQSKLYFGNNCLDSRYCGSPVMGINAIMKLAIQLPSIQKTIWSSAIVTLQLEFVQIPEFSQTVNTFSKYIEIEFAKRYQAIVLLSIIMIFSCLFVLYSTYKMTVYTINQLYWTQNRIKILKDLCTDSTGETFSSLDMLNK